MILRAKGARIYEGSLLEATYMLNGRGSLKEILLNIKNKMLCKNFNNTGICSICDLERKRQTSQHYDPV
jgi:recombinational DNA repair protein RecR